MNDQTIANNSIPEYLGITEAADYLRVSASTLRRWEKKGFLIPERTPTGIRRYTKQQLDAVLQQGPVYAESYGDTTFDDPQAQPQPQHTQNPDISYMQGSQPFSPAYTPLAPAADAVSLPESGFISSHRHAPPPTIQTPPSYSRSVDRIDVQPAVEYEAIAPAFSHTEDDLQKHLNNLSHAHLQADITATTEYPTNDYAQAPDDSSVEETTQDEYIPYQPYSNNSSQRNYTPASTYNFSSLHNNAKSPEPEVQESYDEQPGGVPYKQPIYAEPTAVHQTTAQHNNFSYTASEPETTTYDFEEDTPVYEFRHEEPTIPQQDKSFVEKTSKTTKKSGGMAMFFGVFVGILLITLVIWSGYMFLSGGFGQQALLSPIP